MRLLGLIGAIAGLAIGAAHAAALSPQEQAIVARVDANFDDSLAFLEKTVDINSDTMNKKGVRATGAEFAQALGAIGFKTRWADLPAEADRAGHLIAVHQGDKGERVLLMGHLDTVFPEQNPRWLYKRDGDVASGPGVNDMKGGDVAMLYALKALKEAGALDGARIEIVLTGDEEKPGQPISVSRKDLIDAARRADVALNFEAGEKGAVVTARRGSSGWRLTTTGLRSHSSGIFSAEVGAGSVFEAARILNAFYDELAPEKYLTFNPGVIVGGTDVDYDPMANKGSAFGKTNVVSQKTVVDGGLRFISEKQKEDARRKMREIVAQHLPKTGATIEFEDSYPAMPPTGGNKALLDVFSSVSEDLGYGAVEGNDPGARGAADVSFAAPYVAASMDGLGVMGGGSHTPEETLDIPSLKEATARAAIFIYRLTREGAPDFSTR